MNHIEWTCFITSVFFVLSSTANYLQKHHSILDDTMCYQQLQYTVIDTITVLHILCTKERNKSTHFKFNPSQCT